MKGHGAICEKVGRGRRAGARAHRDGHEEEPKVDLCKDLWLRGPHDALTWRYAGAKGIFRLPFHVTRDLKGLLEGQLL